MTNDPSARDAGRPGSGADPVRDTWKRMHELFFAHGDRRREVTEALGMSFFRAKALRRVARGPVALRDLASELLTDRPYTTLVVDDLTERGLVERIPNPSDRRSKLVRATEAGLAAAARAEHILGTPPAAMYDLPPDDLAALDRIIGRILADPGDGGDEQPTPPSPGSSAEF
ncbi:MarR family winged helix-turn-helix transcriptional regulator [Actinomadura oligospora]|uniref:MarR family winged helix-turn-helix transcriptional regulator n=1 Tax=Actinomadura oligospora TaxID=111804 RepID=UPI0004B609DE|nr:MarR family transcriptional regulator [Actinomadura oligospora]